jgi:16S rRNA (guanine1207-N2)-methyltransferase
MRVPRTFSGPVQLLGAALEGETARRPLIALPPEPGIPALFEADFPGARFHYFDYAIHRADRKAARGETERFTFSERFAAPPDPYDLGVLFLPKGKDLIAYALGEIGEVLAPGTPFLVAGANRGGIRSSPSAVEAAIGPVAGSRVGRHSVVHRAVRSTVRCRRDESATYTARAWGRAVTVVTLPGVFSHGALDAGTRFLLETLEPPAFRRALDWGCGGGVIGAALQLARPRAVVDLVDADAMALAAARLTLAANGFDPGRVKASDGFSDVTGAYDLIAANPPFHAGIRTELAVTERMIADSARFLLPGGKLVFVANAHHDFREVLARSFGTTRVLAEDGRYRVMEAS